MRKIISLTIPIGLMAILFITVIVYARASAAVPGSPVTMMSSSETEQFGPPWYDEAWHYRRRIVVTNSGNSLEWYQVLIKLDGGNFNFDRAKTDGSDIRFTHSDGTTDLKYWIESWDKAAQLAYVWVRVPSLTNGTTKIYFYYNNPQATWVSNGAATFDGFDDDWEQYTSQGSGIGSVTQLQHEINEVNNPFVWTTIQGSPEVFSGILNLQDGDGIESTATYTNSAIGMSANFSLGFGNKWGGFYEIDTGERTMIGDLPADPDNLYLIDYRNDLDTVLVPRVGGNDWHGDFHIYELRWKSGMSVADVDHGLITAASDDPNEVPNTYLPVVLFSYTGSSATLEVDWVYVRRYQFPEPVFELGEEQGLVELMMRNIDSPDPLKPGTTLTYQLTITNSSMIDASEVVVTDTLPLSVQLGPVTSSQGSCIPGSVILCDLNIIPANSMATITIVVTPTVDGEISNNAVVGSPGYELDLSDNTSKQTTFVDSQPPVVIWERPVFNGELYFTFGGQVTLEASATDNSGQLAWVEFRLWDHNFPPFGRWMTIGTDPTYPYQALFDSSLLAINDPYQMFIVGGDRAGNVSDPYNPLQRIFIERRLPVFLPLLRR